MGINYDGVYEIRLKYTTTPTGMLALQHTHTIDVQLESEPEPGEEFINISVVNHNGSSNSLEASVDNYVAVLDDVLSTSTDISIAELWKYPAEGSDAQLISVYDVGVSGALAGTPTPAHQWTLTLTSAIGGVMRVQLMETALTLLNKFSYPFPAGNGKTVADYLQTLAHPWVARDNSRPLVPRFISGTQNEKLARKRYRS